MPSTCPQCNVPVSEENYFCSNCGNALKTRPPSTSIGRQITVYTISIFLPPFGLWPAVKYLRQSDRKSKAIGYIAIALSVLSIVGTVWLTISLTNSINQSLQDFNTLGF